MMKSRINTMRQYRRYQNISAHWPGMNTGAQLIPVTHIGPILVIWAAWCIASLDSMSGVLAQAPKLTLSPLPQVEGELLHYCISPDRKRLAYVVESNGKHTIVVDGKIQQQDIELMKTHWLSFSPDSSRAMWVVQDGLNAHVVVDGVSGPSYDDIGGYPQPRLMGSDVGKSWKPPFLCKQRSVTTGPPHFSSDSRSIAYLAKKQEQWGWTIDKAGNTTFHPILGVERWNIPHLSPDHSQLVDVIRESVPGTRRWVAKIIHNGKTIGTYSLTSQIESSENGNIWICPAWEGNQRCLIVAGKQYGPYDGVSQPAFSFDGKHYAFLFTKDEASYIIHDGNMFGPFGPLPVSRGHITGSVIISADGKHFAAAVRASRENRWGVVHDGNFLPGLSDSTGSFRLQPSCLSPAGNRVAWSQVSDSKKHVMFLDGKSSRIYENVGEPQWSPDSQRLVYRAKRDGHNLLVLDEVEQQLEGELHPVDDISTGIKQEVILSSDGRQVAYVVTRGHAGVDVVVDGKVRFHLTKKVNNLGFSPDGKRVIATGPGLFVDGPKDLLDQDTKILCHSSNRYCPIFTYERDGSIRFLANRKGRLYHGRIGPGTILEPKPATVAIKVPNKRLWPLAISPDGDKIAVRAIQLVDGKAVPGRVGQGVTVCSTFDGRVLGSVSFPRRWESASEAKFIEGGKMLALFSSSRDEKLFVWDVTANKPVEPFGKARYITRILATTQQADVVAGCTCSGRIVLWESGKRGELISEHKSQDGAAFSPDGRLLACYGYGKLNLVKVATGSIRCVASGQRFEWTNFTPDGKRLVALASQPWRIWTWDVHSGEPGIQSNVWETDPVRHNSLRLQGIAVTKDSQYLVILLEHSRKHLVTLWDIDTGRFSVHISPYKHHVLLSPNGMSHVWPEIHGMILQSISAGAPIHSVSPERYGCPVYSPDGACLAVRDGEDGIIVTHVDARVGRMEVSSPTKDGRGDWELPKENLWKLKASDVVPNNGVAEKKPNKHMYLD